MVSLVGEHDPIALAKATATLDQLSQGRLLLGVGFGWNREEFEDHGFPARVRADVVGETVGVMKRLWCDDVVSYDGAYRTLSPSRSWPKLVQQPHIPVILGVGASERSFDRIVAWADGWVPMASPVLEPIFALWLVDLRRRWETAGRDPARLQIVTLLTTVAMRDLPAAIDRLGELGVQRVGIRIAEGDATDSLRRLDRAAAAITALYG